jgi:hypothetical protein
VAKGKIAGTRSTITKERLAGLVSFLDPHRRLSVRSCLYRLSAMTRPGSTEKLYPGTDHLSYRSLKELTRTARISGECDTALGCAMDDCFEDNKRILVRGETFGWSNIAEFMEPNDPRHYKRNRWQDQSDRIHVWVEKDTLRGLISSVCYKWDVTQLISMGTFGRTLLLQAAQRIDRAFKDVCGRLWIFYVGDFDPSGLAIEEWAQRGNEEKNNRRTEGLWELLATKFDWTPDQYAERIHWKRIAVTAADFQNPALADYKISIKDAGRDEDGLCLPGNDPRAADYKAKYGNQCLEAEALEVLADGEIARRLDAAIERAVDLDSWEASERKQKREIRDWLRSKPTRNRRTR